MKTVIVTGGAGAGIGHGIVEVLAESGWSVVIVDRDGESGRTLAERLVSEGRSTVFRCDDLANEGAAESAVAFAMERFGRLDGLVNNAGIGLVKPITEVSDTEFRRLFQINFDAVFRFSRAAVPELAVRGGAIVNIGSIHARATNAGYTAYAAAKGAVEAFTRALAVDCGPRSIRVNCVHPGLVMSPQNRGLLAQFTADVDAWLAEYVHHKQLIPKLPSAREVGELVAFLLSDAAATITGQAIAIDGGSTAMLYER